MDSLRPCAFCRGEAKIRGNSESFYAACTRNECAATTRSCRTVTEALTVWNTRTPPASGDGKGEFRQRSDDCREWERSTPAAEAPAWDFEKLREHMKEGDYPIGCDADHAHWVDFATIQEILNDALRLGGFRGTPKAEAPAVTEEMIYRAACAVQSCRGLINEPGMMLKKEIRSALEAALGGLRG